MEGDYTNYSARLRVEPECDPQVNEFYKKGCQEKTSPSTGGREDFSLEIQPTDCKCPSIALERFGSGLFALPVSFIFRW